ncbi:CPBP family intramembrane glutamic endopeptidase [Erwinia oleae]|uniref:CPBP family intramembrane glutamic endopeptidase n=1 Tax=Erwinia oleae TaxID=796334 RepID=UPI000550875B|nr:CPBP family intramembrane glutamic endopeptidase [Erwinia oleae]
MRNLSDRVIHTLLCAGMFVVWYAITLIISMLPYQTALRSSGMLMPLLCALEFCVLAPLYYWYCRHYDTIPLATVKVRQLALFSLLLLALIISQSFFLRQESWTADQLSGGQPQLLLFALAVIVLAPVFEEILFRGFVLQGLLLWAPDQRFACALLTSLLFAAMHTQYAHLQTIIALSALSLLLCYARLLSGGLLLPVMLHMLNNAIGMSPWIWRYFSHSLT